ncbi:MAG: DNA mismatch repair endonuclease MutL [Candidatus Omnitrophica bacterium]|nr:DNA mismatch repair endonuclease MutL [Candidatus Omnitrophota bacterium]MDD5081452.1 DNA mismatch repair endonuclease MutL [Candidatus Omnitrophota bacterium]MDD5440818.1 DNA mismatch repair endonuclease MutL [Candidatus Omnitrophota bacterium]
MAKVNLLSPDIISKIAAGEVIDRPSSIIKELLENSIDAEAGNIEIHLKQSGKKEIIIRDNGTGIEPDDIETIFKRHSTSKIKQTADLYNIATLGFRGEALYSISSVSDITIKSKTLESETGWQINMRANEKISLTPIAMSNGTEITVKEIFFNTPARKKFLKTDSTELHNIIGVLTPYMLLFPGKTFKLTNNKKTILDAPEPSQKTARISEILKLNKNDIIHRSLKLAEYSMSIDFFLGSINIQQPRKTMQFVFVNNRPVYNYRIPFQINQAYRTLLPQNIFPFFAIFISMPPEDIDSNIHPSKKEIQIKDEQRIAQILRYKCQDIILTDSDPKQAVLLPVNQENKLDFPRLIDTIFEPSDPYKKPTPYTDTASALPAIPEKNAKTPVLDMSLIKIRPNTLKEKLHTAQYIGSYIKKYLFFESGTSLLIADQHAAQERITYEALISQIEKSKIEIQPLLSPITMKISAQEMVIWEIIHDKLKEFGFETTLWSSDTIALHAYPMLIKKPQTALLNFLSPDTKNDRQLDTETIAKRACKGSLTAGYDMSPQQADYIIKNLLKCKDPFTCPHGRPTLIEIKEPVFEKQFLRI